MKKRLIFSLRYPKLTLLLACFILAYFVFAKTSFPSMINGLGNLRYSGVFIAGMLFTFGFSAPFSAGFFLTLDSSVNIYLAAIIGGFGAMLVDLLILKFIRLSFRDEFLKISKSKPIKKASKLIDLFFSRKIRVYLMYAFAGILIASPLPDEAGVIMFAGLTKIKAKILGILSFVLNTIGILILLLI